MRKAVKVWLIVAAILLVLGGMLFGGGMMLLGWDFTKLSTDVLETNIYELTEDFDRVSITVDTADIVFVPTDGEAKVVCREWENGKHTVFTENGTLTVKIQERPKWYETIGIHFSSPKITVYLPKTEYSELCVVGSTGDVTLSDGFDFEGVDIRSDTGDISIENCSAGNVSLKVFTGDVTLSGVKCRGQMTVRVSTGDTKLTDVTCESFTSSGNTGDLRLKDVIASDSFSIERTTGDVVFDSCDAARITVEVDTGDVTGSLRTGKSFSAHSNTGKVDVPGHSSGGECRITATTGDIRITVE